MAWALAACSGGSGGAPPTQLHADAGERPTTALETPAHSEDGGALGTAGAGSAEDGSAEDGSAEKGGVQTAPPASSFAEDVSTDASGASNGDGDRGTGDKTNVPSSPNTDSLGEAATTSAAPHSSDPTNAMDAGALPRPPEVSPIAALVESLLPGPSEVTCNTHNPCEVGHCALDTHPCDGTFSVAEAPDLDALQGCTSVSGDLSISAPAVVALTALQSLVTVGGDLIITGSDALTNLVGLDSLISVAGDLTIGALDAGNANLVDLAGLEQLEFVGGLIRITSNPALQTLDGFEIEEHQDRLIVQDNAALMDIEELASLACLGMFTLHGNPWVTHLDGLDHLEQLGALRLSFSSALTDLDALKHLEWIPGIVELYGLDSLTSLSGLSGLVGVGSILVNECAQLQSYSGLESLTVVRDDLWCYFDSFAGLEQLRAVGGELSLEGNGGSVIGLDAIEMVEELSLKGDIDLDGLEPGTRFGGMKISFNATIEDLRALENVWVSDGLALSANTNLRTLDGFRRTDDFLFGLSLFNNPALTDLRALRGVRAFYDQIVMWGNESLVDFAGLDTVEHVENRVIIRQTVPFPRQGSVGLERLTTFDGWLIVDSGFDLRWVPALESVGTLSFQSDTHTNLTEFSHILVQHGLWVSETQNLVSLDGLLHDGELEDGVHLDRTPLLTDLDGLRGVTAMGELDVSGNVALTNLDGLSDLESMGSQVVIADNPRLENLDGLARLTAIENEPQPESPVVSITNNVSLPQCAAEALVARLVDLEFGLVSGNDETGVCH